MAEIRDGRDALAQIERALAGRPHRDGAVLKAAVQSLARFRDRVVALHREDGGPRWRACLERINAVISVTMAAEFPIGEVPWGELERARDWLDALLRDEAVQ